MKLHILFLIFAATTPISGRVLAQEQSMPNTLSIFEVSPSEIVAENNLKLLSNSRVLLLSRSSSSSTADDKKKLLEIFPDKSEAVESGDIYPDITNAARAAFDPAAIIVIERTDSEDVASHNRKDGGIIHNVPREPIDWAGGEPVPLPIPQNKRIRIGNLLLSTEQSDALLKSVVDRGQGIPLFTVK